MDGRGSRNKEEKKVGGRERKLASIVARMNPKGVHTSKGSPSTPMPASSAASRARSLAPVSMPFARNTAEKSPNPALRTNAATCRPDHDLKDRRKEARKGGKEGGKEGR